MISTYYTPTKIIFGKGAETKAGELLKGLNVKKVLLHYGQGSVIRSGLLSKVKDDLIKHGIEYTEAGGVVPNPRVSLVRKYVKICKEENIHFILAVGGGSVIDSAKAIAYGTEYDGDVWDIYMKKATPVKSAQVGVILTIAATGSEMSDSSVISDDECNKEKRGYNSDLCRPVFSLLNPELTYSVSPYQTACGVTDIIMHTLERFFLSGYALDMTDKLACSLIKEMIECGLGLKSSPESYDLRANVMWASTISHNGLMNTGNDNRGDWACHQLEHTLSAVYDVAHGAGLAAVWCHWADYVKKTDENRFRKLGNLVFNLDINAPASKTIECFNKFFKAINMPTNLKELGLDLTDDDLKMLANKTTYYSTRTIGGFMTLNETDIYNIYKTANI